MLYHGANPPRRRIYDFSHPASARRRFQRGQESCGRVGTRALRTYTPTQAVLARSPGPFTGRRRAGASMTSPPACSSPTSATTRNHGCGDSTPTWAGTRPRRPAVSFPPCRLPPITRSQVLKSRPRTAWSRRWAVGRAAGGWNRCYGRRPVPRRSRRRCGGAGRDPRAT